MISKLSALPLSQCKYFFSFYCHCSSKMMILGINQMRISSYQCVSFVHVFHKNDFQAGFFSKKIGYSTHFCFAMRFCCFSCCCDHCYRTQHKKRMENKRKKNYINALFCQQVVGEIQIYILCKVFYFWVEKNIIQHFSMQNLAKEK